jgi:hypothetical protein
MYFALFAHYAVLEVAGLEKCFILYSTIQYELHQNEAGSQIV